MKGGRKEGRKEEGRRWFTGGKRGRQDGKKGMREDKRLMERSERGDALWLWNDAYTGERLGCKEKGKKRR
jgi:hypothetical protein